MKRDSVTDKITLYTGSSLAVLSTLESQSVNLIVTSPPYYGLRDYGTADWDGGDPSCSHVVGNQVQDSKATGAIVAGVRPGCDASRCKACGATRIDSQIGLEPTPEEYVEKIVAVFREAKSVLRDDGVFFLNLGDSYAAQKSGSHQPAETLAGGVGGKTEDGDRVNRGRKDGYNPTRNAAAIGLKNKDLIGIPWRVAFALQADGWYLRQDIIWDKPNVMPESVEDRCTKSHEYIFLLAKSERYYFDFKSIQEPTSKKDGEMRNKRSVWRVNTSRFKEAHFATFPEELIEPCILAGCPAGGTVLDPFNGAGTTGLVAMKHGMNYIGIELNPEYVAMSKQRLLVANGTAPGTLFAAFTHGDS